VTPLAAAALALAVFAASLAGTRLVLAELVRRAVLDHPNERSSHTVPTPRGGGIAVMAAVLPAWLLAGLAMDAPAVVHVVAVAAFLLATLSFADDLYGLPVALRFGLQAAAVAAGLAFLPDDAMVFQGLLPIWIDRLFALLAWLWFVNLYNFMDGIDGISGVETVAVSGGAAAVAALAGAAVLWPLALLPAAAMLGFLWWNRHPARIFLGDVGSVPLGYLLGWLLLVLAAAGVWIPALILPLYYLADATVTLVRRGLRGEKVWRPHREHFYQRAVQAGRSHAETVRLVLAADLVLVGLALAAVSVPSLGWPALAVAVLVVLVLLDRLRRPPSRG